MGLLLATVLGLIVWIVLWATGAKSFDAFMITTVIVVLAAAARMLKQHIPGRQ